MLHVHTLPDKIFECGFLPGNLAVKGNLISNSYALKHSNNSKISDAQRYLQQFSGNWIWVGIILEAVL